MGLKLSVAGAIAVLALGALFAFPQTDSHSQLTDSDMELHYEAAYRLQAAGDNRQADVEHKAFLVDALHAIANAYGNVGDFAHASSAYEEALALKTTDGPLIIDYARAAMDAHDPRKTQSLLQRIVNRNDSGVAAERADAHRLMGDALIALGNHSDALDQYQLAYNLDPGCGNLDALGNATLSVKGKDAAAPFFLRFIHICGDTAVNHMTIGRAFALDGLPDRAVEEFHKAAVMDPTLPDIHYSLGAAYMTSSPHDLVRAKAEFLRELALHPKDAYCWPQLGRLALEDKRYQEAMVDLRRAIAANPYDASNFILLGNLYSELGRASDAEADFRKAIVLTVDPSQNDYAIERAHYHLARILISKGEKDEGQQEMAISQDLLEKKRSQEEVKLGGRLPDLDPLPTTKYASSEKIDGLNRFRRHMSPLIAGSYNNLGVHAAMAGEFASAASHFYLAS
jgi:tetratricopeptide (TPR) repeat protein